MVDIWALGVLLYFMLVGVTPFRGETVMDLKRDILIAAFTIPNYVSSYANQLICRMLEKDTSKRANIHELRVGFKNTFYPIFRGLIGFVKTNFLIRILNCH